jgi:tripartite-type tricarboxylate transporter receptor subunit TctC
MEGGAWFALYAPAGTPRHIVDFINREANQVLGEREFRERMAAQGVAVPLGSPEDLRAYVQQRTETWARVAKAANIKLEQ